jgi:hypothetical protein
MQYARTIYGSRMSAPWYRGLGGLSSPTLPPGFYPIPVRINYHGLRGTQPVRGMGADSSKDNSTAQLAEAGAGTIISALSKCGPGGCSTLQAAGQVGGAALVGFAAAGPIGAAVSAATSAIGLVFNRKGPKQRTETTAMANQAEPLLQKNLAAYLSEPRTASSQAQALANFDAIWQWMVQNCNTAAMGNPGKHCVEDRQSGACVWKASPGGWSQDASGKWSYTPAGPSGSGDACWNWFVGYRDPITNDPAVIADPVLDANGNAVTLSTDPVTGKLISTPFSGSSSSFTPLLIAGALLFGAVMIGGSK